MHSSFESCVACPYANHNTQSPMSTDCPFPASLQSLPLGKADWLPATCSAMAAHERAYNPIVDRDDAHSPDTSSVGLALQRQYSSLKARLSKRHLMQIAAAAVILALFAAVVVLALQEGRRRDEHRELEALRELRSQAESEAEAAPGPEPGPEIEPEPEPEPVSVAHLQGPEHQLL